MVSIIPSQTQQLDALSLTSTVGTKRMYTLASKPSTQNTGGIEKDKGCATPTVELVQTGQEKNLKGLTGFSTMPPIVLVETIHVVEKY